MRYSRRCIQLPPTVNSRPRGRSLPSTTRELILLLACASSAAVMPSRSACAIDLGDLLADWPAACSAVAAHVGHEHAGALVVVMAEAGLLGQARSTSSQYSRLPESSPSTVASILAA